MAALKYMVDTSAANRLNTSVVQDRLVPLIVSGLAYSCPILDLEALYSAQSPSEYSSWKAERAASYLFAETDERDMDRALEVQSELAAISKHRVALPDLIIAATSERHGLTILHYDHEYDLIAEVTGQPTSWVVPRGEVN